MRETLLLDVPHRQVVFTIPKLLRIFFKFKRRLLGDLCRCALRSLAVYGEVLTGSALTPGVVAAIQTFGNRINFHPHLHYLVTEGGTDATGVFHELPRIDDSRLAEIFAREVLAMLVRKELLNSEWAERILSWRHTGFNVHSLVRAKTKPEAERVGKHMIRPVLSLERLSFLEQEGKVGYRHGEKGAEQETMDYLEFIARVTAHIPDKGQVMVRYYGLHANAHIYRSSEADVRGGEAPAVPCFYRGRSDGGRGEQGLFLIICDHGERESIVFQPVREDFLPKHALPPPLIAVSDIAARPVKILAWLGVGIQRQGREFSSHGKSKFFLWGEPAPPRAWVGMT